MYCVIDSTTDPYWNLAAEEYLLTSLNEPIFRLWQNEPAVIVGKNQNTLAEINSDYVTTHNIPVVRRLSGGGAVFHDLGNINFTFIDTKIVGEDSAMMFRRFTTPIIEALNNIGIEASLEGRNDLVINSKKFSGNAIYIHNNRILQHGTLLFSSSLNELSGALQSRPEKFNDKAVKSNRSRVTNISEHLSRPMTVSQFLLYLKDYIGKSYTEYYFSPEDIEKINTLADTKYRLDSWNYGCSPKYKFSKCIKFRGGLVELYMNVEKGVITKLEIKGDYFFKAPTEEFCQKMLNTLHSKEKIIERLNSLAVDDYFAGISSEELIALFV